MTRVLVVEDEESFSDALSYMLRKEGFEVDVASSGPAALEEFDRSGADLVLLDLMLPGLPGTEVPSLAAALTRGRSGPRHHAHRQGLRDRQGRGPRARGRRLRHQAVLLARELVARIRAVLRRRSEPEDLAPATLEVGPVRMDVERHVVSVRGGARSPYRSRSSSCSSCCATLDAS